MTYTLTLADASYLADLDTDHLEYQADPCSYQYQPEYKLAALAELRNRYAPRGQRVLKVRKATVNVPDHRTPDHR
jgi:hypothetical protein